MDAVTVIERLELEPHPEGGHAQTLGAWTLVSCTVSPAFRFEGFELAPDGWAPG